MNMPSNLKSLFGEEPVTAEDIFDCLEAHELLMASGDAGRMSYINHIQMARARLKFAIANFGEDSSQAIKTFARLGFNFYMASIFEDANMWEQADECFQFAGDVEQFSRTWLMEAQDQARRYHHRTGIQHQFSGDWHSEVREQLK